MNLYGRLPLDLQIYIGQYIPYKHTPPSYLNEYQELVLDFFNRHYDTHPTLYYSYKAVYDSGLTNLDINWFQRYIFKHIKSSKYYYFRMNYSHGFFRKILK